MSSHRGPERCSAKGRGSEAALRHLPSDHAAAEPGSGIAVGYTRKPHAGESGSAHALVGRARGALNACTLVRMVTLADIEAAAVSLSPAEKQELMLFLASRLRAEGAALPEPRVFSADEMARWIAEDEADMRRLREQP